MKFLDILKSVFFIVLILSIVPNLINNFVDYRQSFDPSSFSVQVVQIGGAFGQSIDNEILSSQPYVREIQDAAKDPKIKAIVLSINSPGGVPGSSELISNAVSKAKQQKPVITLISDVCASGAYWIASSSSKIISPASAIVGSVGVILSSPVIGLKKFLGRYDISVQTFHAGKYKAVGSHWKEMTPEESKYLEDSLENQYKIFAEAVAKNRNLRLKEHSIWGDGKIFSGQRAFELGLVDQIGGYDELEKSIRELLEIPDDKKISYKKAKRLSALAKYFGGQTSGEEFCCADQGFLNSLIKTFAQEVVLAANKIITSNSASLPMAKI